MNFIFCCFSLMELILKQTCMIFLYQFPVPPNQYLIAVLPPIFFLRKSQRIFFHTRLPCCDAFPDYFISFFFISHCFHSILLGASTSLLLFASIILEFLIEWSLGGVFSIPLNLSRHFVSTTVHPIQKLRNYTPKSAISTSEA